MKLTQATNHGRKRWRLSYELSGRQVRRFFATKAEAEAEIETLTQQKDAAGEVWMSLSAIQRNELLAVNREVDAAGLTLRQVWEAFKANGGASLTPKTLGVAITELVAAKESSGRRRAYIKTLRHMLESFARGREASPLAAVKPEAIEIWLGTKANLSSRATYQNRLNTLFSFCVRRGYLLANPCDRLERITIEHKAPTILTVRKARAALKWAKKNPRFLGWLSLALLAGVRPEEADRLTWEDVDLKLGTVRVDAAASKVRQRRIVHLQPSAIAWLALARKKKAPLPIAHVTRRRLLRQLRDHLKLEAWPKDVLRHSAASYWLALWQDAGKVAHELGHSAGILLTHYKELVTKEEAEKFWGIRPGGRLG